MADLQPSGSQFDHADLLENAIALSRLGRHEEAIAAYEQVLARDPENLEALNNCGASLGLVRRYSEALKCFSRVLELRPNYFDALNNRATSFHNLGRHGEAVASYDQALKLQPDHVEVLIGRSGALIALGRHAEALSGYDRALSYAPGNAAGMAGRGRALTGLKNFDEALKSFTLVLDRVPDDTATLIHRGNLLTEMRRHEAALADYERVLELKPGKVEAIINRCNALTWIGRCEEAVACVDVALEKEPEHYVAVHARGNALARLKRYDEALECYDYVQKVRPDVAGAHFDESICRLLMGDYELGFKKYEWRLKHAALEIPQRHFSQSLWMGKGTLEGKTILVHMEQGLGDLLQFIRYVPLLADRGATVFLEVPTVLVPLVAGLKGVSEVFEWGDPLPSTDFYCSVLSLPLALGTTLATVPSAIPYLSAEPAAMEKWRAKLAPAGEKLIGVCWRGNPGYTRDHERSIPFGDFAPLMSVPGVRFVSLQKDLTEDESKLAAAVSLVHPGADFKSTAELVSALDLLISVDTAWPHWAGAIGRPFWLLLPYSAHWVWLSDRKDSPWYPTATVFRQSKAGAWKGVIKDAKSRLARFRDKR